MGAVSFLQVYHSGRASRRTAKSGKTAKDAKSAKERSIKTAAFAAYFFSFLAHLAVQKWTLQSSWAGVKSYQPKRQILISLYQLVTSVSQSPSSAESWRPAMGGRFSGRSSFSTPALIHGTR